MLTQKNFEKLAAILAAHGERAYTVRGDTMLASIINDIARYCAEDNPRFDRDRFAKACGLESVQIFGEHPVTVRGDI